MKYDLRLPVILLLFGLFLAPAAFPQGADNARVVRLSRAEGQVLVLHSGNDIWEDAQVNLPLLEGDTLATQDGLAEVEFESGATAYLAENSVLQFSQLDFSSDGGRATELNLTQGAGTFYANLANVDSFRVQTLTFQVAIPNRAEFRVDAFPDGAAVQVTGGDVSVSTAKGSTELVNGQSVAVHEKDFQGFSIGGLPDQDEFDQWVTQEGDAIRAGNKNTLSYVSSPNEYGLSDLSVYGIWANIPNYGFCWRPYSAGISWTPYFNGKWTLDSRLGWIWVSNEPWGWMPYHFGSWLLSPTLGWVWVPGGPSGMRQWQPARVNWVRQGGEVGWVAMSPKDRDGAPANLVRGMITQPQGLSRIGNVPNKIVVSKDPQSVKPLREPPADFVANSPATVRAPQSPTQYGVTVLPGQQPVVRQPIPPPARSEQGHNGSIVFDRGSNTFISSGQSAGDGDERPESPVHLPRAGVRSDASQTTVVPPRSVNSYNNHVVPQSSSPVVPGSHPVGNAQPSQTMPGRVTGISPQVASRPLAPVAPPPVSSAPPMVVSRPAVPSTPAQVPQAPRATPAQPAPTPHPASPPAAPSTAGISPQRHQ